MAAWRSNSTATPTTAQNAGNPTANDRPSWSGSAGPSTASAAAPTTATQTSPSPASGSAWKAWESAQSMTSQGHDPDGSGFRGRSCDLAANVDHRLGHGI